MEEIQAEILVPFELQFSDLLLLSNPSSSSSSLSLKDISRLELISNSIMETLGPSGPGLLSIAGVLRSDELRKNLLPFARKLTLLGNKDRARILKEHGLGSDVPLKDPNRTVSSFSSQLKYRQNPSVKLYYSDPNNKEEGNGKVDENPSAQNLLELSDLEFKDLGSAFKELGLCMMELGLHLARVCDNAIGGRELEQSIVDSCSAKGRLIHYHSMVDNLLLKESSRRMKGSTRKSGNFAHNSSVSYKLMTLENKFLPESRRVSLDEPMQLENLQPENRSTEDRCIMTSFSNLWQQWHYDYGIFTVLTTPWFMPSSNQPCCSPDGHTYLQLFDATENKILMVKSAPESFIIQDDNLHMNAGVLDAAVIFCYLAAHWKWFVLPLPFGSFEPELWPGLLPKLASVEGSHRLASSPAAPLSMLAVSLVLLVHTVLSLPAERCKLDAI